jgi:hypothetical protein
MELGETESDNRVMKIQLNSYGFIRDIPIIT